MATWKQVECNPTYIPTKEGIICGYFDPQYVKNAKTVNRLLLRGFKMWLKSF
jgi:hypothetical protein